MSAISISALQALQLEFDSTHNLDRIGLPSSHSGDEGELSTKEQIGAATFASLALAGECGEVANAVKKAVRATHLGLDATPHLEFTRRELADVLAYLLKLAAILGSELGDEYLETVALNSLRFSIGNGGAPKLIGVAGSDTALVAATLARVASSFTTNEAQFVDLPAPTHEHPDSMASWVRECSVRVASSFERTSGVVVVSQDPAFHVHLARQKQHSTPSTNGRAGLIDALVKYEQLAWRNAGGRQLVILADAKAMPDDCCATTRLRNHGAFVFEQSDRKLSDSLTKVVRTAIESKARDSARSVPNV
jgi:NTP pyrophosphatase (non-canonical NTP hydrolase)